MDEGNRYRKFEHIYQEYAKAMFRFVYFKVSDLESALDITQDVFLRFWKVLSQGQEIENPKAFLFLIARGMVIDFYRKKKTRVSVPLEEIEDRWVFDKEDLDKRLDDKKEFELILSKLRELKDEYRDVLLLYYVEDLPVSDIAFVLNKKENAVRVLIHRALKELKGKL